MGRFSVPLRTKERSGNQLPQSTETKQGCEYVLWQRARSRLDLMHARWYQQNQHLGPPIANVNTARHFCDQSTDLRSDRNHSPYVFLCIWTALEPAEAVIFLYIQCHQMTES